MSTSSKTVSITARAALTACALCALVSALLCRSYHRANLVDDFHKLFYNTVELSKNKWLGIDTHQKS